MWLVCGVKTLEDSDAPWEVLALCIWFLFACFCMYMCSKTCGDGKSGNCHGEDGDRQEYAVVVDPGGTIRVGVQTILERSKKMLGGTEGHLVEENLLPRSLESAGI